MKSNILFTVTDASKINELKGQGIEKFVWPLNFFCVGIPKTFDISEVTEENSYLFINRVLDTKAINDLKEILNNLPSNIKGIIFDDLGLINLLKDLKIEKILYNTHFTCNYESINYMFDYVDEVIISTDITEEEIDEIISKSKKRISLFTFGLVPSFYSRRTLLTNYATHHNLEIKKEKDLYINDKKFISIENKYGTMLYHYPYFNGTRLLNKDVKYLFYFPILIDSDKLVKIANNDFSVVETDEGFLSIKTIYKVKNK